MPLLENDVVFAYLNELDPGHKAAERIFGRLQEWDAEPWPLPALQSLRSARQMASGLRSCRASQSRGTG